MTLKHTVINFYTKLTFNQKEEIKFLQLVSNLELNKESKVLEVGCGYGRILKILNQNFDFHTLGVEKNEHIVSENNSKGINCISLSDYQKQDTEYDLIIMSHIIEHFQPDDLLTIMDSYLTRLKKGSHLIILTPLHSQYFYNDFDHIRPYQPAGLTMVFGGQNSQVQYYSKNQIKLVDLWFRRGPFRIEFARGLFLKKYSKWPYIANLFFGVLFKLSFSLFGQTDGWIGVYQKN